MFATDSILPPEPEGLEILHCHVWDPDGPHVAARMQGMPEEPPLFLRGRLGELATEHEQR